MNVLKKSHRKYDSLLRNINQIKKVMAIELAMKEKIDL